MLSSYPAAWLLLCVPFLSSLVIRSVPWLWRPAVTMNRRAQLVGLLGLVCFLAAMFGLVPLPIRLPLALAGGFLAGYTIFSVPRRDDGGDGDDWSDPGPDEPPSPPGSDVPIDWGLFDHLRADWERRPVLPRR